MNTFQSARKGPTSTRRVRRLVLLPAAILALSFTLAHASPNISIWDTASRMGEKARVDDRSAWKIVPKNLFSLEADPAKAASDPGYSGRDFTFAGDAVVENRSLMAVFSSAQGCVILYAKSGDSPGKKVLEFSPRLAGSPPGKISRCEIIRNVGDEAAIEATFSGGGSPDVSAVFLFGRSEIVEIKPSKKMTAISLAGPIAYGVVPSFVGDDLILWPSDFTSTDTLHLPAENVFLGLLKGEDNMLVMTWPKGRQRLRLNLRNDSEGKRAIDSIDFDNDGQNIYLAALSAPGLWHSQELKPAYLEKDVPMDWKRPFPGKWVTQLPETTFKTTFRFRDSKSQLWRAVAGSYIYPVWFDGDNGYLHLSKKVPPKGQSVIYFREGDDTPLSISTPVDIIRDTLGRQMSDSILDVEGRKLRTHHRRGGDGVHRACTCGCTEAIQAVFEAGDELDKKPYISEALGDMVFFVQQHVARIGEYRDFADSMLKFLKEKETAAPELKEYIESLQPIVGRIPEEFEVQKENMKSMGYADELVQKTMALTGQKDPGNLKLYMELLKLWRGMGGAQDSFVGQCHVSARKLLQEAGYACLTQPKALDLAIEIRNRCRQVLRNPDGYEIWGDY